MTSTFDDEAASAATGDAETLDGETRGEDGKEDGRERKGAAMRARLRAATEEIIASEGYDVATAVEVARRTGVSRGAVLHHYPTRDDLIIDTARHFWRRAKQRTADLADGLNEGRVSTADFVQMFYDDVFLSRGIHTMLELIIAGRTNERIAGPVSEILADLFRAYETLGETAFAARGAGADRIHVVITLIGSTLRGLRIQEVVDPDETRTRETLAALVEAVDALLPPAGSRKVRP
ncbi:TetR/AcrR family transcriptional regulator [Acuticoccus sediminis]|nr:TetR/AcrR family transcriptional regulator [Acuticoccus sediminis]